MKYLSQGMCWLYITEKSVCAVCQRMSHWFKKDVSQILGWWNFQISKLLILLAWYKLWAVQSESLSIKWLEVKMTKVCPLPWFINIFNSQVMFYRLEKMCAKAAPLTVLRARYSCKAMCFSDGLPAWLMSEYAKDIRIHLVSDYHYQ